MKRVIAPVLLCLSILLLGTGAGCPESTSSPVSQSYNLVNETLTIGPGEHVSIPFYVDANAMQNLRVYGSFRAAGGSRNDIWAMIMDDTAYINWVYGHQVTVVYSSGQVTTANINVPIARSGKYHLVFSNHFSIVSSKNVSTTVALMWLGRS